MRRSEHAFAMALSSLLLLGASSSVGVGCATGGYSSYAVSPPPSDTDAEMYAVAERGGAYAGSVGADATTVAAQTTAPRGSAIALQAQGAAPTVATDATRVGELRIYTAELFMAVFDVRSTEDAIVARVGALGGYLASRDDTVLVVRVPSARFDEAVAAAEGAGQLLHRNVRAEDVTEQFRDLETRIRTLDAMRARLETLLANAANVAEALAVERELERVTVELESLRGRLRYLGDRVAYSTITVRFQLLAQTEVPDAGRPRLLPFRWLRDLGLAQLLDL